MSEYAAAVEDFLTLDGHGGDGLPPELVPALQQAIRNIEGNLESVQNSARTIREELMAEVLCLRKVNEALEDALEKLLSDHRSDPAVSVSMPRVHAQVALRLARSVS